MTSKVMNHNERTLHYLTVIAEHLEHKKKEGPKIEKEGTTTANSRLEPQKQEIVSILSQTKNR